MNAQPEAKKHPLWTVEEKARKRWSFTARASSANEAIRLARECGCSGPATVREVKP